MEYGPLLRTLREGRAISQRRLARAVGLDSALLNRSEAGTRSPAGTQEVNAIAKALDLNREERDALLEAAGYWPAAFSALGPRDETMRALARALTDDDLPVEAKRAIRQGVKAMLRAVRAARGDEGQRREPSV